MVTGAPQMPKLGSTGRVRADVTQTVLYPNGCLFTPGPSTPPSRSRRPYAAASTIKPVFETRSRARRRFAHGCCITVSPRLPTSVNPHLWLRPGSVYWPGTTFSCPLHPKDISKVARPPQTAQLLVSASDDNNNNDAAHLVAVPNATASIACALDPSLASRRERLTIPTTALPRSSSASHVRRHPQSPHHI